MRSFIQNYLALFLHGAAVASGGGQDDAKTPAEWVAMKLGFIPDAIQALVLNTPTKRGILNCTRQWGKSTVTAAKAVHKAYTEPGSLTLVVSPSGRQSGEMVRKAAEFTSRLGIKPKGDGHNEISLALPNGSRIIGLPATEATVRGFSSVSMLLVDEAARVEDDLYMAMRPMLAVSGGTVWLISTPHGRRGFFWETWENGGRAWERVRVTAEECPRIPAEFLAEERVTIGERRYLEEYGCEFTAPVDRLFDPADLEKAFSSDITPLNL